MNWLTGVFCVLATLSLSQSQPSDGKTFVYECDFDSDDSCGGTMSDSIYENAIKNIQVQYIEIDNYNITDVSSITKPTASGSVCVIPFNDGKTDYYHCNELNQCDTENGPGECFEGRFLGGSFNKKSRDEFSVEKISVAESGAYELSYFYYIYCPSSNCASGDDFIQVTLSQQGTSEYKYAVRSEQDELDPKQWRNKTHSVRLEQGDLKMTILFRRQNANKFTAYFGIDSIAIKKVEDNSVTAIVPITPEPVDELSGKELIYKCDFDSNNCSVQIEANDFDFRIVKQSLLRGQASQPDYYLSDVTSITGLTEKNNTCRIPFYKNDIEYNHCTKIFVCETQTGGQDTCRDGMFLSGKAKSSNNQTSSITFPLIKIESEGYYVIEFYWLIYCEQLDDESCKNKTDKIVFEYENGGNVRSVEFDDKEKRWNRQRVNASLVEGDLQLTILLEQSIEDSESAPMQYGIDELSLYKVGNFSYDTILECDFDNNDCGIQIESDLENFEISTVAQSTVYAETNYIITDVSSITKPTNKNNFCRIPFVIGGTEYYHCTLSNRCVTIQTGQQDFCAKGKFLNAKISAAFENQVTSATLPELRIEADGKYKIEYYVFMYCDRLSQADCQAQNSDMIFIEWQNNDEPRENIKYSIITKAWKKQSHTVQLKQGTFNLSVLFVRPYTLGTVIVQFGFDSLKISKELDAT